MSESSRSKRRSGMVEILDPTGKVEIQSHQMAERPGDLNGKTLGILHNGKPQGDVLLERIVEGLAKRFALAGMVRARKPSVGNPAPPDIMDKLSRCDVVINAIGD